MKVYIIEDEEVIRQELCKLLECYGYTCETSDDFEHIIELALNAEPDLILLDINLPYFDGFHVCRNIRQQSNVPIIMVTSSNQDMDELMSMNLGADDFITKPYNKQILLAHIQAVLNRSGRSSAEQAKLEYKGWNLDLAKGKIAYRNEEVELTKNEMRILSLLMRKPGEIVSREELMEELWQSDAFVDDNTLTVNVNRLRHKLQELGDSLTIATKRGLGYYI